MKPGDLVKAANKIGYLHMSDDLLTGHAFSLLPGTPGMVLELRTPINYCGSTARPVCVLFGDRMGWCFEHELEVINEGG